MKRSHVYGAVKNFVATNARHYLRFWPTNQLLPVIQASDKCTTRSDETMFWSYISVDVYCTVESHTADIAHERERNPTINVSYSFCQQMAYWNLLYVFENQQNWESFVPPLIYSYICQPHRSNNLPPVSLPRTAQSLGPVTIDSLTALRTYTLAAMTANTLHKRLLAQLCSMSPKLPSILHRNQ